ncbi:hypothetical protein SAMN05192543_104462 [Paraburkholderia megapolitana]|uniref:Uncharacterized protein n=1 Tax=Paraburkholderia megapolitana TaxID=420953 RepID=A0A1I3LKW8_9BURK|nr:hypothetical protein SAMN05192543_104462 [Paraburkholderia megapolitana]
MIFRLIRVFLLAFLIWMVACSLMWGVGAILYSYFNGLSYSLRWSDIKSIVKLTLIISFAYTFLAWLSIGRS